MDPRVGCGRWPEHLRLLNETTGEVIQGRCKATNLCLYCQARYVAETVEALLLDALYGTGPTVYIVLTAREHLTRRATYQHLKQLRDAARRRWPDIEWFVQVEFQVRGALHLNLLVKGVPVDDRERLHALLSERWCARVDASPKGQWSGTVYGEGGLAKYLGKRLGHGLKQEQAPPLGWRGHRTSQTRGYFNRPITALREEARRVFRHRALVRRAIEAGYDAHEAELLVVEQEAAADQADWRLLDLTGRLKRRKDGRNGSEVGAEAEHAGTAQAAEPTPSAATPLESRTSEAGQREEEPIQAASPVHEGPRPSDLTAGDDRQPRPEPVRVLTAPRTLRAP